MRIIKWLILLLPSAVLLCAGCGKSDQTPPAPQVHGVTVDVPKLTQAFANAPEQTRTIVTQVGFNIRYTKYEDALKSLDALLNDPGLTPEQKKMVSQVIEQVKQLAGSSAAPAQ